MPAVSYTKAEGLWYVDRSNQKLLPLILPFQEDRNCQIHFFTDNNETVCGQWGHKGLSRLPCFRVSCFRACVCVRVCVCVSVCIYVRVCVHVCAYVHVRDGACMPVSSHDAEDPELLSRQCRRMTGGIVGNLCLFIRVSCRNVSLY